MSISEPVPTLPPVSVTTAAQNALLRALRLTKDRATNTEDDEEKQRLKQLHFFGTTLLSKLPQVTGEEDTVLDDQAMRYFDWDLSADGSTAGRDFHRAFHAYATLVAEQLETEAPELWREATITQKQAHVLHGVLKGTIHALTEEGQQGE